jgi:Dolichyl-phosphate-mannose-protein mannosyltransferase
MRRLGGWGLVLLPAFYLALSYFRVLDLRLVPRTSLEPWLLNHGFRCYGDIIDQHEVGLPLFLSFLLPISGSPSRLAKWVLMVLAVLTTILVYAAGQSLSGRRSGQLAALFFAVWVPMVWAGMLWYEIALAPLYVGAYALWPVDLESAPWRVLAAGLAVGVAVTVKQYAWVVVAVYVFGTIVAATRRGVPAESWLKVVGVFGLGVAVPVSAYAAYIVSSGASRDYLYWAWRNNLGRYRKQAAQLPTMEGVQVTVALMLPAVAVLLSAARESLRRRGGGEREIVLAAVALATAATVYPRFEIFHLAAALPLLSVTFAVCASPLLPTKRAHPTALRERPAARHRLPATGCALLSLVLSVWLLVPGYRHLWHAGPRRLLWYTELRPIAERVKALTAAGQPIFVFPDDEQTSNTYLLSNRLPPGIWVYTYPWYMTGAVMRRIIEHLESRRPPLVVYFDGRGADGRAAEDYARPLARYIRENYRERESMPWASGTFRIMVRKTP